MILDILTFISVILVGLAFPKFLTKNISYKDKNRLRKIWFFHIFISLYFCFFTFGDAIGYWRASKNLNFEQFLIYLNDSKGTYFMYSLNYFPSAVLNLSYFSGTMLYSLFGYIGIVFFYLTTIKTIPYNSQFKGYLLFPLVFFIPNLHFWSSGVGKDTLLFMCVGMFSYGMLNIVKRIPLLVISLLLSYLIRPHITLFLFMGFGLAFLFSEKVSAFKRVLFTVLLIGAGLAILPSVMKFAKIEETSIDSFNQFSENKADLLSRSGTGSAIDISSYPFPLKVFTFLYRPFFFDIRGIPAVIASFENLLLLLLTVQVFKNKPIATFKSAPFVIKGLVFFLIIGTLAFSQTLGNVGIMIRMRNMFLPGMLIFILWSFSYQQQKRMERQKSNNQ